MSSSRNTELKMLKFLLIRKLRCSAAVVAGSVVEKQTRNRINENTFFIYNNLISSDENDGIKALRLAAETQ